MSDWQRFPLPWHWEEDAGLSKDDLRDRWEDLAEWVSRFASRYHLERQIACCWPQHPNLVEELKALRYWHEEVTSPQVPLVQPDPVGSPQEPPDPEVSARAYLEWQEARWRWTQGPLREATGYRECLTSGQHVADHRHEDNAGAFAEATKLGVDQLFDADQPGGVEPPSSQTP